MNKTTLRFQTERLSSERSRFTTEFVNKANKVDSKIEVVFDRTGHPREGTIVDVYSQNGRSHSNLSELLSDGKYHLFSGYDVKGMTRAATELKRPSLSGRTVLVLDLKDPEGSYRNIESIRRCEEAVSGFMKNPTPGDDIGKKAKQVHKIAHSTLPIDHVLNEGSLKHFLLDNFVPPDQVRHFLDTGKEGHADLCQFTEPFINALKLGYGIPGVTDPSSFFSPINTNDPFKPGEQSIVYYPESYGGMYSPDSPIPTALRRSFPTLNMDVNEQTRTTSMTINDANPSPARGE